MNNKEEKKIEVSIISELNNNRLNLESQMIHNNNDKNSSSSKNEKKSKSSKNKEDDVDSDVGPNTVVIPAIDAVFDKNCYNDLLLHDIISKEEFEQKIYHLNELTIKACMHASKEKQRTIYISNIVLMAISFICSIIGCILISLDSSNFSFTLLFTIASIVLIVLNLILITTKGIRRVNDFDYLLVKYINKALDEYSNHYLQWRYNISKEKVYVNVNRL